MPTPSRLFSLLSTGTRGLRHRQLPSSCPRCLPVVARLHSTPRRHQVAQSKASETTPRPSIPDLSVTAESPQNIHVTRAGVPGHTTLDAIFLRDHCPQSKSPSSGNKSFATAEIPENIQVKSLRQNEDANFVVEWANDIPRFAEQGHVSVFTPSQLLGITQPLRGEDPSTLVRLDQRRARNSTIAPRPLLWDKQSILQRGVRHIDYNDWRAGGDEFYRAVLELSVTGLLFIQNVPKSKRSVEDIGLTFGALQETFYGRTWDVISKPRAENVAYTSEYLGLHSDMLYLDSPPKLQYLHCLENEAVGGESLFSDAWRAAAEMQINHPSETSALTDNTIGFHYDSNGFYYAHKRKVFEKVDEGKGPSALRHVWWSPPFQAPFALPEGPEPNSRFLAWHKASAVFQNLLEDETNMLRRRLQPGECVVFDNRRVLHGRTAFDANSGPRHFHGTYTHEQDWHNVLCRIPKHVLDEFAGDAI